MKMSAKKVMSLALAGLLSVSLMACSGSGSAAETQAEAEAAGDTQAAAEGEDSGEKKVCLLYTSLSIKLNSVCNI